MANALDALLARIADSELRQAISSEVSKLKDSKDFGLVFERHLPESVRLPGCDEFAERGGDHGRRDRDWCGNNPGDC